MRILPVQQTFPSEAAASCPPSAATTTPAVDLSRLLALERMTRTILERLELLEQKIETLKTAAVIEAMPSLQAAARPAPAPKNSVEPAPASTTPPPVPASNVTVDEEVIRKGLLTKMWKYLNDSSGAAAE